MKVSVSWLKDYVDIKLPVAELAHKLAMAGTEVKAWQVIGGSWEGIVVGRITAINPHPNADRLLLPTIDLGGEERAVVCGAPNLKLGDKVAFARVGARLIDGHTGELVSLEAAKIRGVVSEGMVCSEKELGISESHETIMVLPAEAPVGKPLADYMGDVILDLDITPNRPDCLSVIGIAREIAALTGQKVRLPADKYDESATTIDSQVAVGIIDADLCPRYSASLVRGIKIASSPPWMQQRLIAAGMRPINNIVDITNYVMLEYGEPLHAFDYDQIRGQKIIVRRAKKGEVMVTLDGNKRALAPDMLVIADTERAVALAGVMGGYDSEVTDNTTDIFLEAASFNPAGIYETGNSLGLPSEARMRFERGISAGVTIPALKRATQLLVEIGGGQAAKGFIDAYPAEKKAEPVRLRSSESKRLLGVDFSIKQMKDTLEILGFEVKAGASNAELFAVTPYWRSDVSLEEDLIEEVARIIGYDEIPITMLSQSLPPQNPAPILKLKPQVSQVLADYGFQEVITFSLTGMEAINKLMPQPHPLEPEPLRMVKPMTAEQEYLRPNLRANLLSALESNLRHEESGVRLFELGRVYHRRKNDLPDEPEIVCGVLAGPRFEPSWRSGNEALDFYDAKGVIEGLFGQLGVEVGFEAGSDESLHPFQQAVVVVGGKRLGVVGELHPKVADAFEIAGEVYLFEVDLTALLPFIVEHKMFQPISRFPAVVRDMALVLDAGVTNAQAQDIMRGFPLVTEITLFDLYSGEQLPAGKKSLAYRISYQSPKHTLTDDEVNKVQQQILDKLSKQLGATLRA
ncbi:MAG TPA: phenylalanine--tRNA ligase subunit beta [Dehalococcoidales bacterium]|nr:phenylalanine--tRNA ligase subunit beta [Dehalococcoidales bacterium]